MKIALDEHIPTALLSVFTELSKHGAFDGCDITSSKAFVTVVKGPDVHWIENFAAAGGNVIISGEKKMRSVPHVQRAIQDTKVIAYYLPNKWNEWDMFKRAAFILNWWNRICAHAETAQPGTLWMLPPYWESGEIKEVKVPDE